MKKNIIVIIISICVLICLVINVDLHRQDKYLENVENDFTALNSSIKTITEYLISCEDEYIDIYKSDIITICGDAGKELYKSGYFEITKQYDGVYFYKYKDIHGLYGLMYHSDNSNDKVNELVTERKKINDCYYYFREK